MRDAVEPTSAVIPYATPEPRRAEGPFARSHATLGVVGLVVFSMNATAFVSRGGEFIGATLLLNVAAALLTPVVILLRRPGSIHWAVGALFFVGTVAILPAAVLLAAVLMGLM